MNQPHEVSPLRRVIDIVIIFALILVITHIHYTAYNYAVDYHIILQFGYYVPVIYAAMRFGAVGSITTGLFITVLLLPHLSHFRSISLAAWYTQWVEILLINGIGWLMGFLSQQEQKVKRRYQQALLQQSELVEKLKKEGEQRQRLEEEIRLTERLTALGHLSAGLAHEIRNPLGVIKMTAQLLSQERPNDLEIAEYCGVLQEESGRLNRLLSDFLSFARPKEPIRHRVVLSQVVQEGLALVQPLIRQSNIELVERLGDAERRQVEVDLDQMKQVMVNVLINAIQAQGEEGIITVEGVLRPGFVGFSVNDNGPGIPDEILPYVYDPLYSTKDKGTGLGLSIVHGIITQHDGKISINNRPEGGVRVQILLPLPN